MRTPVAKTTTRNASVRSAPVFMGGGVGFGGLGGLAARAPQPPAFLFWLRLSCWAGLAAGSGMAMSLGKSEKSKTSQQPQRTMAGCGTGRGGVQDAVQHGRARLAWAGQLVSMRSPFQCARNKCMRAVACKIVHACAGAAWASQLREQELVAQGVCKSMCGLAVKNGSSKRGATAAAAHGHLRKHDANKRTKVECQLAFLCTHSNNARETCLRNLHKMVTQCLCTGAGRKQQHHLQNR